MYCNCDYIATELFKCSKILDTLTHSMLNIEATHMCWVPQNLHEPQSQLPKAECRSWDGAQNYSAPFPSLKLPQADLT